MTFTLIAASVKNALSTAIFPLCQCNPRFPSLPCRTTPNTHSKYFQTQVSKSPFVICTGNCFLVNLFELCLSLLVLMFITIIYSGGEQRHFIWKSETEMQYRCERQTQLYSLPQLPTMDGFPTTKTPDHSRLPVCLCLSLAIAAG